MLRAHRALGSSQKKEFLIRSFHDRGPQLQHTPLYPHLIQAQPFLSQIKHGPVVAI